MPIDYEYYFPCFQCDDDNSSWYSTGVILDGRAKKKCQTEVEVIRDWFVNIFMPLEKTGDLEVTDFKFEQIAHWQGTASASSAGSNGCCPVGPAPAATNGNTSAGSGSGTCSGTGNGTHGNGTATGTSSGGYPGATESDDTSTNTTTQTTTTTQQVGLNSDI